MIDVFYSSVEGAGQGTFQNIDIIILIFTANTISVFHVFHVFHRVIDPLYDYYLFHCISIYCCIRILLLCILLLCIQYTPYMLYPYTILSTHIRIL
jgi:hypothetical protein